VNYVPRSLAGRTTIKQTLCRVDEHVGPVLPVVGDEVDLDDTVIGDRGLAGELGNHLPVVSMVIKYRN